MMQLIFASRTEAVLAVLEIEYVVSIIEAATGQVNFVDSTRIL